MAFRIPRQADHAPRHLPDVGLSTREDPEQRTAEVHLGAERLAFADDDVGPEVSRRADDRLRDRVHADDEDAVRHGSNLFELLFESSEEVRVLHVNAADIGRERGLQLREIEHPALAVVVHLAHLNAGAEDVIREDRAAIVPQGPGNEEDPPAMDAMGHPGRFTERRRAVIHRRVRGVHPGELADQALVLPQRLE